MFWNVRGLDNVADLIPVFNNIDIFCLCETWSVYDPSLIFKRHFVGYEIVFCPAIKTATRGRARGGILVAFNNSKFTCEIINKELDYIIIKFVSKDSKFEFIVCSVYISPTRNIDDFLSKFEELIDQIILNYPTTPIYIGGDFNSRISDLNQLSIPMLQDNFFISNKRYNLDVKLDLKGKKLINSMENNGLVVLNGRTSGDNPAQFTFVSVLGKSTIDLVWSNFTGLERILDLVVHNIVTSSDHFPVSIKVLVENIDKNKKQNYND